MNPRVPVRTLLLIAALLPAAVALAQTAPQPASEDVQVLTEFRVNTAKDDGFIVTESASGTRVATDIINLPFSISVLTEDFVKEFQLFDLDQQAPFISGMAAGGGGTRLRGFSVPYFRNGFARTQAPNSNSIARTEVIKGPRSAIYSRVSPGGVINFISKKPGTRLASGLSYVTGSYDHQRIPGDITGPIIADKLFYRVDATYYDFNRPTDFWYNRTTNLSGSLTYKLSSDTLFTSGIPAHWAERHGHRDYGAVFQRRGQRVERGDQLHLQEMAERHASRSVAEREQPL